MENEISTTYLYSYILNILATKSSLIQNTGMDNLIELPKKPIDPNAELMRLAGSSKIVSGFFNQDGEFHSFLGDDLTYCDMLFIIDSLRRRMDKIYPS